MAKAALTDAHCRNLKTRGKASVDLRDTLAKGLELRATAGRKVDGKADEKPCRTAWRYRYTRKSDGERRQFTFGTFPEMSLTEARAKAMSFRAAVANGADPAGGFAEAKAAPTFAEVAERWLADKTKRGRSPRSLKDVQSLLRVHVNPQIGHMRVTDLKRRHIIAMLDAMDGRGDARGGELASRQPTTRANHVFAWTRAILRWAMSKDLIEIDPTAGVKPPLDQAPARDRVLSPEEIRTLWAALEAAPETQPGRDVGGFPMLRATAIAMQLALATGQRIGEVAEMPLAELSLNDVAPMWTIGADRAKNGVKHEVPLSPLAVRLIRAAMDLAAARAEKSAKRAGLETHPAPAYLFPGDDASQPMKAHAPTKALGRARSKIAVARFNVHDLRRTCATYLGESGVAPHVISAVLNHVSASRASITQAVYNRHSYAAEKRDALERWAKRLEGMIAGGSTSNVVAFARQ